MLRRRVAPLVGNWTGVSRKSVLHYIGFYMWVAAMERPKGIVALRGRAAVE